MNEIITATEIHIYTAYLRMPGRETSTLDIAAANEDAAREVIAANLPDEVIIVDVIRTFMSLDI